MNKKREILTVAAMVALVAIIFFHYFDGKSIGQQDNYYQFAPFLVDVRLPIFALGVFYAGLFVILGDNKRKE